jgi:beta-lactamase superfamily II metal-dependent hydrolase
LKLIIYQAECGDAARIEYTGADGRLHNILIDTGFERTYRDTLQKELAALEKDGHIVDVFIISHVHDDHIGGAIAYIKSIQRGLIRDMVHQWVYNPPRGQIVQKKSPGHSISSAKSIAQGDLVASYLSVNGRLPELDFTSDYSYPPIFGLKLTILSPSQDTLKALRIKYPKGQRNPFEREEPVSISLAKSKLKNDYYVRLKDFVLDSAEEDNSIENGSSIAVLVEQNNKLFLNLADAHPSVIASSLKNMGYSTTNPLICDWVKVAHHGSKGNNMLVIYNMIRCNNFIISSNGQNKYMLPSKQCLATIVRSPQRTDAVCNLYFTYDNPTLRSIFAIDGDNIFDEFNFMVFFSSEKFLIFGS